jgi:hypothetical protein
MAETKREFDFFINNYAKPFIVKSDLMQPDPVEFQRLQQFQNDKWSQIQQGLTKGLSVHDMLDQRNRNFIGGDVTRYQLRKHRKMARRRALASGRIWRSGGTEGRGDAAAGQLFAGGIRRQEKADAAGQVFGRDGAGGSLGAAG